MLKNKPFLGATYISLFIHQEEAILVFAQKIESALDIILHFGNTVHIVRPVVVTELIVWWTDGGRFSFFVIVDRTPTTPTGRVTAVNTTVREVTLSCLGEFTAQTNQ